MNAPVVDSFTLGVEAYRSGDFLRARQLLQDAVTVSAGNADAQHLLAVLLARDGLFDAAEKHFLSAIQSAPARYDFVCNYALCLHDKGQSEQAAALFNQVIRVQPHFAPALNGLGNALYKMGDLAGAEQTLRQAVQAQPNNPQQHNNLGNVLKELGKVEQALSCYQQALAYAPQYAEAHFNLGISLKDQSRFAEARACFQRAVDIRPNYSEAADQLEQLADFWGQPLVGKSVVLRRYGEQHASFLFATFRNAEFMARYNRMIPPAESLSKLAAALRKSEQTLPTLNRSIDWVIYLKDSHGTEQPIGLANLVDLDQRNRRAEYLLGIVEHEGLHARLALEASLLVMEFAFNHARLNKITSIVYEGNLDAQSPTLQLGFQQEGFRPRHMYTAGQGYIGLYENGMHAEDFRANTRLAKLSQRWLGRDVTQEPTTSLA